MKREKKQVRKELAIRWERTKDRWGKQKQKLHEKYGEVGSERKVTIFRDNFK